MYKNFKIAAVIPARKGSKGLPNKNIIKFNGMPLVAHTIKSAKETNIFDEIIVSTDFPEIVNIAGIHGIMVKGLRPAELSNDTATLCDVIKYEIDNYNLFQRGYSIVVLLQPTSPLRNASMIRDAVINFIEKKQSSAVSVSEVEEHPVFMRTIVGGELHKILPINSTIRRQDLSKYYKVNGAIYINRIEDFNSEYLSLNDNSSPILIPKPYDVDIDTYEDLEYAETLVQKGLVKFE